MKHNEPKTIELKPIGTVRSTRKQPTDDHWLKEQATIELDSQQFTPEALLGLQEFSHVEIIYHMHQVENVEFQARHPRGNKNWPRVGIFAQRAKNRPNQIGTSVCRILKIDSTILHLEGLDAIDGTPVLDIKPWVCEFAPKGSVNQPSWITELMKNYWS